MIDGIHATLKAAQQFVEQSNGETADAPSDEPSLESQWQMALMAIDVMEKQLGTEEQRGEAWQFIGELMNRTACPRNCTRT
jgi:hypothetical protein